MRMDQEGFLYYKDRMNDLIIIGKFNLDFRLPTQVH